MTKAQLKYDYVFDPEGQHAGAHVLNLVGHLRRVLEIGAGAGSMTKPLKSHNGCAVTALEIESASVEHLRSLCERVVQADLNDHSWAQANFPEDRYQAVVIADVLEHLLDPVETLKAAASLLTDDGAVVVSLPHIANNAIIACLMTGDFDYRDWGLLDRTHLRFFAMANIQRLVDDAGLKISAVRFVMKPPKQTEFAARWRSLPKHVRMSLASNPYGSVYQVVFRAVPKSSQEPGIDLLKEKIPRTRSRRILKSRRLTMLARTLRIAA